MNKRIMKIALGIFAIAMLLGIGALGGIKWHIHRTVELHCQSAQHAHPHPGDDVAALIDYVNSDSHTLWDRTHRGIWTLGQLRDSKALPSLESAYTGEPCDHDRELCQYELEKAIKLCGGTPNPPRKTRH